MKKLFILIALVSIVGVAHAQTTITADTATTQRQVCIDNGGSAAQCQQVYDSYMQSSGSTVPNNTTNPTSVTSGFTALAPIPGLTDTAVTSAVNAGSLADFFNNLYKYLIGLAAVLAIIEIIWGGLEISTKDSVSKQSDGKERITQALLGLVLVLAPVLVFSIINPSILNLSLNLPKLNTLTTPSIPLVTTPTLPPCGNGLRTNCVPPAPTQMGNYPTPTPGLFCFERTNPGAANDFVCMSTQAGCNTLYNDNVKFGDNSAVSTCRQY